MYKLQTFSALCHIDQTYLSIKVTPMHEIDVQDICKHDRTHLKCTVQASLAFAIMCSTVLIFIVYLWKY